MFAESEGFEPSDRISDQQFSRLPRSTTPATLLCFKISGSKVIILFPSLYPFNFTSFQPGLSNESEELTELLH